MCQSDLLTLISRMPFMGVLQLLCHSMGRALCFVLFHPEDAACHAFAPTEHAEA